MSIDERRCRPPFLHHAAPGSRFITGADLDRNCVSRIRYVAILRGILALLAMFEIAAWCGAAPSVVRGGLAGMLALPFFAPSLFGAFAAQLVLRPRREEVAASLVIAAALAWPLFAAAATSGFPISATAGAALGIGALAVLGARAVLLRGDERAAVLDVLLPALVLPAFVLLAHPMVYLTAALWPTTFDHRMYLADAAFGAPLSFVVGRATAAVPYLPDLCLGVYVALPLALALVHAVRRRDGVADGDVLVTFVALTIVGYFGYHIVPVAGPVYAFDGLFPQSPPDPATLSAARSLTLPMPRNCMPSLHSGWALLVWWNARALGRPWRLSATLFLAITLLATVGLGFHYVVDVVAAFPLTMAIQAWGTSVTDKRLRRVAIGSGLAGAVAWITLTTLALPHWPATLCWLAAIATVAGASVLERRVYAARCGAPVPETPNRRLSLVERGVVLAVALTGAAAFLLWAILANTLPLMLGTSAGVRAMLVGVSLGGLALGAGVAGMIRALDSRPLAGMAAAIGVLLMWCLLAPVVWASASQGFASLMLLPFTIAAGAAFAFASRALQESDSPGVFSLTFAAFSLGGALAAIASGYLILPTLRSASLPTAIAALALVPATALAVRQDRRSAAAVATGEARASTLAMLGAGATIAALAVTVCAHLVSATLADTVYARAQIAFAMCAGLACGSLLGRSLLRRTPFATIVVFAAFGFAASVALGLFLWSEIPAYLATFRGYIEQHQLATSFAEREFVRLWVCLALVGLPALTAGCAFAAAPVSQRDRAFALIAAGAALGAVATGFVLLPAFGSRITLVIAGGVALVVAGIVVQILPATQRRPAIAAIAVAAIALVLSPSLDLARINSGSGVELRTRSFGAAIDAREDAAGVATSHGRDERSRVVVNGALRVSAADLATSFDDGTGEIASAPQAVRLEDVRRSLLASDQMYALIHTDRPDFATPETGWLFTREFYELTRTRLGEGGTLRQELPLRWLSAIDLTSVLASARRSFEHVRLDFTSQRATLVACIDCDATGRDAALDGTLDTKAVDRMLASAAERLGASIDALSTADADMFLAFHVPRTLPQEEGAPIAIVDTLKMFAAPEPAAPSGP